MPPAARGPEDARRPPADQLPSERPSVEGPAGEPSRAGPPAGERPPGRPRRTWVDTVGLILLALTAVGYVVFVATIGNRQESDSGTSSTSSETKPAELAYSELSARVERGEVAGVQIHDDGALEGTLRDGGAFKSRAPTNPPDDGFVGRLLAHDVTVEAEPAKTSGWRVAASLLPWLVPIILLLVLLRLGRRAGAVGARGFGRSTANVVDPAQPPSTTFADIAGYEGVKEEIGEIVDYLRRPERYKEAGAKGPGGVLMVGPPGTGKTLFARAIAGQAGVPFFSASGSSFVELYVGVGASRVRDLFQQARQRSPAIVFIDEIDAIGQVRSPRATNGNDEREQTLNQLLAEMDGFDPSHGVVVLAATNRPDTLDPALLRPGRFDRQVVIPLPSQGERREILKVHCADKKLGPDVDLASVARATPGFSGADLANLANEAAIAAVRDGRIVLGPLDFETALDRIVLGRRERNGFLLADERRRVAIHEAGHAVVAAFSALADPVSKISILPTGNALGVTHQLPVDERHLYTEDYLHDALAVRLAGRVAEDLSSDGRSSGAADDLAAATRLAERMVREFGLSEELGPRAYPPADTAGGSIGLSEETQQAIDRAVAATLRTAEQQAAAVLRTHRQALQDVADELERHEVLDGAELYRLLGLTAEARGRDEACTATAREPSEEPEEPAEVPEEPAAPAEGEATPWDITTTSSRS